MCEHGIVYALCVKCRNRMPSKMGTLWLLDSGASLHFTHDLNNFIEYRKLPPHERIPVKTAANKIYVEGEGAVLLKHYQGDKMVTTRQIGRAHV